MRGSSRWVRAVWGVAFAVLVWDVAASTYNVHVLIDNDHRVTHTRRVKQQLADLMSDLNYAETEHRGYVLTGRPEYRTPHVDAVGRLPLRQGRLRELLAADPDQLAKLTAIDRLVAAKVAEMAATLAAYDRLGPEASRAALATGRGKELMDAVRTQVASMDRRADEQLAEQSAVAEAKYRATTATSLIGGGLTLVMVVLAYTLIRAELGRRRRAEGAARLTAAALAASQKDTAAAFAQLDALFDHAPLGIALYDADLRYIRINKVLAAANQVPVADHIGRRAADVRADRPAGLLAEFAAVLATGRPRLDLLVPDAGGGVLWGVNLFPVPAAGGAGGAGGLGVFAQDVTAREAASRQLRESEDRFRTLADAVPQMVWVARPDGHYEYYNSRWYEYTGLTEAECVGRHGVRPLHPADADRAADRWARSLATGEPYEIEYRFRSAHGQYRWFVGRARPVRNPATGAIDRWFGTCTDIDDYKRLEGQLRESEGRFRTLTDALPQMVWSARPDGTIDYYNERWYDFTGFDRGRVGDASWEPILHPDDVDRCKEVWYAAVQAGTEYQIEYRFLDRRTGAYRWHLGRAVPDRDDGGRITRWFGTCTDIDDTRQFADRLAASEERFRTLAEAVPGFVWSAGPDGVLDYTNSRVEDYTGRPQAETIGAGWLDILHPADRDSATEAWSRAVGTGGLYQTEFRVRRADGVYRWFLAQAVAGRDAAGRVEQWYGTCSDVDDFKAESLRAEVNAARFQLLTESVPQMVWNADAAGRVTYFNIRCRDFAGGTDAPTVADWWRRVLHPADEIAVVAAWQRVVEGRAEPEAWEARVRRAADGQYRWFVITVVPLRRPAGGVDQWIGSLSDIDDQKRQAGRLELMVREQTAALVQTNDVLRAEVADRLRAERREMEAAEELRRSNGELEKFAYVASHDLQEPLRKIQAFGGRLAAKYADALDDTGKDYIDRMQSSAARMRVLINDLLAFSRVATRTDPFVPVDLAGVMRDVLADVEVRLAEAGGRVDVGDLPTVPADPTQMRQLFQNLIANALKFRRPDVPPVVWVGVRQDEDKSSQVVGSSSPTAVRIVVADNGIGFEQTYADRIFEVFQRLHGRGEYEGTGIGLAICRKIVERHGGTITARGVPGVGAEFTIDLPTTGAFGPRDDAT